MLPDRREEFLACLALRNSNGLGPRTWKRILEHFGRAALAVDYAREWHDLGLANEKQARNFLAGSWRSTTNQEARTAMDKGMEMLLWSDDDYPAILRHIPNPPILLYFSGDRRLLGSPALAVVGSRQCSRYGLDTAGAISRDIARVGVCVVSGFAAGIDRQAHAAALSEIGSSIAVLGTGLDLLYPATNKDLWIRLVKQGLILTEFAPGTRPDAVNFPHRNRIISGLSLGVLVIEAAQRSGSLITATLALEQGREVFALPGPVTMDSYSGCHQLIRQGATLVQSVDDILAELQPQLAAGWTPPALKVVSNPPREILSGTPLASGFIPAHQAADTKPRQKGLRREDLSADELRLIELLEQEDKLHIDVICATLNDEPARISSQLLLLEMRSLVMRYPGMYYSLCGR